jgi:carotene biosynthesis associated membrane protein
MNRFDRHNAPGALFIAHLTALIFGLIGILIMLPNPDLWAHDPRAISVFDFSMEYAGSIHIILGAATIFVAAGIGIGWRKTSIFFVVASVLSLASELIGTRTGWPFGNYEYTDFLGYKILDRVPYTIPLSWFYVGMASYLISVVLANRFEVKRPTLWALIGGAWFLTVWDLVLDPAMAHESLRVQFWVWDQTGPYFGMPVKNFIGWTLTGLIFMAVSRLLWREEARPTRDLTRISLALYAANLGFAMVLSAGVGLWIPVLLAAVLGLIPATLAVVSFERAPSRRLRWAEDG